MEIDSKLSLSKKKKAVPEITKAIKKPEDIKYEKRFNAPKCRKSKKIVSS